MAAHSFTSFALRASTVEWEKVPALVSRIDQIEKSRGLRSGLLAGQTSLLMNEEIFLWIRIRWSWKRERAQSSVARPENSLEILFSPGQQATLQNVGEEALRVQYDSREHKKQRRPPGLCGGRSNHDRLRILATGDDPSICEWWGSPNSVILLAYHLLVVKFLLVSEHEVRQWAVGHLLENFPEFLVSHGHIIGRKLLAMQHLEGLPFPRSSLNTWCMVNLLTSAAVAKILQLRRRFRRSFSLVFLKSWGERTVHLSSAPWSVKGVSGLLELHDLLQRLTAHI